MYVRAKAFRPASRMFPASFFELARNIMGAHARGRSHTFAKSWIFMRHSAERWRNEKSLANPTGFVRLRKVKSSSRMRQAIAGDGRPPTRDGICNDVSCLRARALLFPQNLKSIGGLDRPDVTKNSNNSSVKKKSLQFNDYLFIFMQYKIIRNLYF